MSNKSKCTCRCYDKKCVYDHLCHNKGAVARGPGGKGNKAYDGKRGKKFENQNEEFDCANEQIYSKNLDELMEYIMQPENENKKNRKKGKKNKHKQEGAEGEEEAKSNRNSTT